jgi:hypothetical protein
VRTQLATLKPRVPTVTVTLAKGSSAASIERDGIELREGSLGVPLPIDPGQHVFVVRAPGHRDIRHEVAVREGQHVQLALDVGSVLRTQNPGATRRPGARSALGVSASVVGGLGLLTGIASGLWFASTVSTYREHCDATGCDEEGMTAAARGRTLNVVSPVAFGVGALGVGVGTYLLLTSRRAATHGIDLRTRVSPERAGLEVSGAF